jgi:hypothetical protein
LGERPGKISGWDLRAKSQQNEFVVFKRLTLVVGLALSLPAKAQVAVAPEEISSANQIIDSRMKQNSLKCDVRPWGPSLDFSFRYQAGFVISANLKQLTPGEKPISYLRVTPEGGSPVLLRRIFDISAILRDANGRLDAKDLAKSQITMSAAFNVGQGSYTVELLLLDQGRSCYKRWNLKTDRYSNEAVPLALKPQTVAPPVTESWDGRLDANGVRLSVLLDAAPMNPSAAKLRAWDRAFLLQALASLLRQVPCQAVQVIAFNLDQQREVFRQDRFDAAGFAQLATVLEKLEPASVPYQALQRGSWRKFLQRLAQDQISARNPPDVVVFLGPMTHFDQKVPMDYPERAPSRFFYFEFYQLGALFPDAIDHLTKALHGTVFPINTANDLASAIQKMLVQVKPIQSGESFTRSDETTMLAKSTND